jgi:calcium-dependent protein kinase
MAPEVLSSQVTPASDIWSAGVMAFQLLTGRLPFDDHRNPFAPSISAVWRSVLSDNVDFNMPWWKGISDDAKDFVHMLLTRWVGTMEHAQYWQHNTSKAVGM